MGRFAFDGEVALFGQLALEGLQREVQLAFAAVLREFDHELVAAARGVHGDPSGADDLLPVPERGGEAEARAVLEDFAGERVEGFAFLLAALEPDGLKKRVVVLQRKIEVPGGGAGQVRDLAAHPDVGKAVFHGVLDLCRELADGEDGHGG